MQTTDIKENKSGILVKTPQDYWAFVPNPLPPALEPSWELVSENSEADRALSELAGSARMLPNPHLLIGPFIRREAVLSSRIEGTQASFSDLLFYEAAAIKENKGNDVYEVENYVKALEYGLKRVKEFPLSLRLIRGVHGILMHDVGGGSQTPGDFRRSQNWIGSPGSLMDATYVPPPVAEMNECLGQLETFLHKPCQFPPLIRLAMVHYQFEAIHPFLDGNGRIGRLLMPFLLCVEGILPEPYLYLSAFFEKNRNDYYRLLLGVSQSGDWESWVRFFLKGVKSQSMDATRRSKKLLELWTSYRDRLQTKRSSTLIMRCIDLLFTTPVIAVPTLAKLLNVTQRTAQINIDKLIVAGILKPASEKKRYRLFSAHEIMRIAEADVF